MALHMAVLEPEGDLSMMMLGCWDDIIVIVCRPQLLVMQEAEFAELQIVLPLQLC
jgi:hypothetical protein